MRSKAKQVFAPAGTRPERLAAFGLAVSAAGIALGAILVLGAGIFERFDAAGVALLLVWLALTAALVQRAAAGDGFGAGAPDRALIAAILCLSLGLRWWSATLTFGVELGADPMNYTNLANALREGRGLVTDDWRYGEGLRAYFPPLYPILLAGFWSLFGASALSTLVLHSAIDLLAAWCIADAGRRLGDARTGRIAALAYLAWPAFALSAGIPQKESLTLLLALLLLRGAIVWLGDNEDGRRRWRHGLAIGLWWGLLSLAQPSLALMPAVVALMLIRQAGFAPVVRLGLMAMPALLLVLAPWWVRNWLLFGAFVPFTTASGMMVNAALRDLTLPFPAGLFDLPEPERAAIMGALAREAIVQNPAGFAAEAGKSFVYAFAYEEAPLARFRHTSPPISAEDHARLAPLLQGSYAALILSVLAAAWRQFRQRAVDPVLVYAFILLASIAATNIWFEFGERHRLILTPFFLMIAAGFWLAAARRGRKDAPVPAGAAQPA